MFPDTRISLGSPASGPVHPTDGCSYEFSEINLKGIWTCSDSNLPTKGVKSG
jgi:hypothetical protein